MAGITARLDRIERQDRVFILNLANPGEYFLPSPGNQKVLAGCPMLIVPMAASVLREAERNLAEFLKGGLERDEPVRSNRRTAMDDLGRRAEELQKLAFIQAVRFE